MSDATASVERAPYEPQPAHIARKPKRRRRNRARRAKRPLDKAKRARPMLQGHR